MKWQSIEVVPKDETTVSNYYTEQEFFNKLQEMFLFQELPITQFSRNLTEGNIFDGEIVDIHGNVMNISVLREIVNKMCM